MRSMPRVGNWYKDIELSLIFEVVAVDEPEQTIETQLIDGAITEFDFDNWRDMILEEIEEPEDWRNAYELSSEDALIADETIHPVNWDDPVNIIETDIVNGVLDDSY